MTPYLYPAPPPSSPTQNGFGFYSRPPTVATSSFFSTLPTFDERGWTDGSSIMDQRERDEPVNYPSMRRNSLGLDLEEEPMFDSGHRSAAAPQSPPLVPFSFPPRPAQPVPSGSFASSAASCPPSPPLVALSLFNFSSDPSPHASSSMSGNAASPTLPSRPVAHPLQSTSKFRLEMTPLPTFHLPLADVEMSPPWSNQDLAPLAKPRKNSVVALPVAPPTPPLTPSEELPPFDWRPQTRGRSTEVNPLSKRRRFH
ncbi:hypothetical protein JCM11491_001036 [Sporobolomyces phaffii]